MSEVQVQPDKSSNGNGNGNGHAPDLSVLLVTTDNFDVLRRTIARMRAQTIRDRIEIVVVAPHSARVTLDAAEFADFWGHQLVEIESVHNIAWAYAAGVRHARAPIVALGEDHSFPIRHWAAALLEAHRRSPNIAAVGPAVGNANPRTALSWADLIIAYGPWLDPAPPGPRSHLPGHNSSYKRDILCQFGDELEKRMEAESVLQWELTARGHELILEPTARTFHTNFSRFGSWCGAHFHSGRVFAAVRASHWSLLRKLFYAAASPLIPLVRLTRILRGIPRGSHARQALPRAFPALLLGLAIDALGQMMGYALGAGASRDRLGHFEFHRERHLAACDVPLAEVPA